MSRSLFVAAVLFAACIVALGSTKNDERVKELLDLQKRSNNGVITLTPALFDRFTAGKGRPYSLFLIADARQFRKKARLDLEGKHEAFSAVARAFASTHAGKPSEGRVFFAKFVLEDARDIFGRLGINNLPFLGRIPPTMHIRPGTSIKLSQEDLMPAAPHIMWAPTDLGAFVQERTNLAPGDLSAAGTASRSRFLPILTLLVAAGLCYLGYNLYQAPIMRHKALYALGGLAVYWFSVSGGMFNIIRGVPMVGFDQRTGASIVFMSGQGQMGAEGFIMGTMYVLIGLGVAGFTRVVPTIKDLHSRRMAGYGIIVALMFLLNVVIGNHIWKTGMQSFWYF